MFGPEASAAAYVQVHRLGLLSEKQTATIERILLAEVEKAPQSTALQLSLADFYGQEKAMKVPRFRIAWVMAFVGLRVGKVEVVNNASFMVIFPLTFIANTFVRSDLLPGPLKTFADWNPVSSVAQSVRQAFGNTGNLPRPSAWSLRHPDLYTLIWVAIILAIFVPLSVRQYQRAASR